MEFLNQTILSNSLQAWLVGLVVFVAAVFLLWITLVIAGNRLAKLPAQTEAQWDDIFVDVIVHTKIPFLLVVGLFAGTLFLELPARVQSVVEILIILTILIQAGIWTGVVIRALLEQYRQRALEKNPAAVTSINVIGLKSPQSFR